MFKDGWPWLVMFMTQFIVRSWRLWFVTCTPKTYKLNASCGRSWTQLLRRKGWVCSFSKGSWQITCKQTKMLFKLFMGLEILRSRWLTKNKCVFSIRHSFRQRHQVVDRTKVPWSTQSLLLWVQKIHILGGS
jgi:hypothetical protein